MQAGRIPVTPLRSEPLFHDPLPNRTRSPAAPASRPSRRRPHLLALTSVYHPPSPPPPSALDPLDAPKKQKEAYPRSTTLPHPPSTHPLFLHHTRSHTHIPSHKDQHKPAAADFPAYHRNPTSPAAITSRARPCAAFYFFAPLPLPRHQRPIRRPDRTRDSHDASVPICREGMFSGLGGGVLQWAASRRVRSESCARVFT